MLELSRQEIDALLRDQLVGRIGCHDQGVTYVVPVFFAYDGEAVYAISMDGQKIRMMRSSPDVCFEVDDYDRETGSWRSAIAYGRYEELDEAGAPQARELLRERLATTGRRREAGPDAPRPVAFRIVLDRITGRAVRR